jgi:hypothetical protein
VTADLFGQIVDEIAAEVADRVVRMLTAETVETPPPSEWRLLSTEQTAELGRSQRWVRERAKTGELPWVKLDSGPLAFLPDDVEAFARARRVPAEADFPLTSRLPGVPQAASANGSRADGRLYEPGVGSRSEPL